jgi:hypothetical protein
LLIMAEFSKRPRDLNQWQKLLVDIATGVAGGKPPTPDKQEKDPAAAASARAGGLRGDKARAEKLSPEERLALARKAVQARWNRPLCPNRWPPSS